MRMQHMPWLEEAARQTRRCDLSATTQRKELTWKGMFKHKSMLPSQLSCTSRGFTGSTGQNCETSHAADKSERTPTTLSHLPQTKNSTHIRSPPGQGRCAWPRTHIHPSLPQRETATCHRLLLFPSPNLIAKSPSLRFLIFFRHHWTQER